jgi:quinol monooxygenase YgiN
MSILIVTAFPEPAHRADVVAAFEAAIVEVHQEAGVELYALHEGPDRLVMIEKYASEEARAAHAQGAPLADVPERDGIAFEVPRASLIRAAHDLQRWLE